MDYELYDSIMHTQFIWSIVFSAFGLLLGICELVYINNIKKRGDQDYYALLALLVITIVICIVFGRYAVSHFYDSANHSYIVYEGDFLVEKHYKHAPLIYVPDKDGIRMEFSGSNYYKYVSEPGKYRGQLVYAEKSRYVVDILSAVKCEE